MTDERHAREKQAEDFDDLVKLRDRFHAKVEELYHRYGGGPFNVNGEIWVLAKNRGGRWDIRKSEPQKVG